MQILLLAISIVTLSACSTERFLRFEEGSRIEGRQNLRKTSAPSKIVVTLEDTNEIAEPRLKLTVQKITPTKETWEDKYSKVGVYEKRCRAWMRGPDVTRAGRDEICQFRVGDFAVSHLLLYGFLLDLAIPFMDYDTRAIEVTRPTLDTVSKEESTYVDIEEEILEKSVKLTVDKKSAISQLDNGTAYFEPKALGLNRRGLKVNLATLEIGESKIDLSADLASFLSAKSAVASQRTKEADSDSKRSACNAGNSKACDDIPEKSHDRTDLVARLLPGGNLGGFRRDTLYTGQSFEVIQKVEGGYLFSANRAYFRNGSYGLAYLKTKVAIPPGTGFCAWFFYTGEYDYVAIDGFKRRIPAFRIYSGETPVDNPYCRSRILEK